MTKHQKFIWTIISSIFAPFFEFVVSHVLLGTLVRCQLYQRLCLLQSTSVSGFSNQMLQCFFLIPLLFSCDLWQESCWVRVLNINHDAVFSHNPFIPLFPFFKVHKEWHCNAELNELRLVDWWEPAVLDSRNQCVFRQQAIQVIRLEGTNASSKITLLLPGNE